METTNEIKTNSNQNPISDELLKNGWKYGGGKNGSHKSLGGRAGMLARLAEIPGLVAELKGKPSEENAIRISELEKEKKHLRRKLNERPEPHGMRSKRNPNLR